MNLCPIFFLNLFAYKELRRNGNMNATIVPILLLLVGYFRKV